MRGAIVLALLAAFHVRVVAQEVAGRCFELEHAEWTPAVDVGLDSIYMGLPSRVRFGSDPAGTLLSGDASSLDVPEGALPSVHDIHHWVGRPDSLFLLWSDGFSGVRGSFSRSEGVLEGMVESFWDFPRPRQSALARLVPVPCSAPHEPERVRQRLLPRFVELGDGRRFELGSPISGVPGLDAGRGRLPRYARDVVVFGAEVAEVRITPTEDGLIKSMHFQLAPELDEEAFIARLEDELGPGLRADSPGSGPMELEVLSWQNRTTSYTFSKSRRQGGPWEYRLTITDPSMSSR